MTKLTRKVELSVEFRKIPAIKGYFLLIRPNQSSFFSIVSHSLLTVILFQTRP